jgi:hypothetical protein
MLATDRGANRRFNAKLLVKKECRNEAPTRSHGSGRRISVTAQKQLLQGIR